MAGSIARFSNLLPRLASCVGRSTSASMCALHRKRHIYKSKEFSTAFPVHKKETVTIYFVQPDGTKSPAKAKVGDNLLDLVIENDIDIDGYGACEGTLACSTCHLIFEKADYDKIPEKPTDEELDMLDLAYGLTDTSRLGCQVLVTKDMDGLVVRVPAAVADARNPS